MVYKILISSIGSDVFRLTQDAVIRNGEKPCGTAFGAWEFPDGIEIPSEFSTLKEAVVWADTKGKRLLESSEMLQRI